MSRGTRIAPYPTLGDEVSMTVHQVTIDGARLHFDLVSNSERVVALHNVERRDWTSARINVQVTASQRELAEGPWSGATCHAVLREKDTNVRTVIPLTEDSTGSWTGTLDIHRDLHSLRAELEAVVTATVEDTPGRIIGAVEDNWTIDFKAPTPRRQRSVHTEWCDFDSDIHPELRAFRDDPWSIDVSAGEPILYLNSSFEGLRGLLGGTTGDRATREAVLGQISLNVWITLFQAAVDSLDPSEAEPTWPGGWHEAVLKRLIPDMYPDRSPKDALAELIERRRDGDAGGYVQTRLIHAATRQAQASRTLTALIRHTTRRDGGEATGGIR
ncbi:hypothetical protein ABIA31_002077 [Catenulispora sp. MAP5-51]|uniref:hypothetical protein n=1 Tax=Catenulispora sp. MAP5-51 TaxID=3156298 RepID=UPI0035131583